MIRGNELKIIRRTLLSFVGHQKRKWREETAPPSPLWQHPCYWMIIWNNQDEKRTHHWILGILWTESRNGKDIRMADRWGWTTQAAVAWWWCGTEWFCWRISPKTWQIWLIGTRWRLFVSFNCHFRSRIERFETDTEWEGFVLNEPKFLKEYRIIHMERFHIVERGCPQIT